MAVKGFKLVVLGIRGFPNVQGGPETHGQNLYPLLVKKGCVVTVFTRKGYVPDELSDYDGVRMERLWCVRNKFLEAFLHTFIGIFAAKKLSPDMVHIHAIGPSLFTPLARMMGMRVVVTNHGPDYRRKKWGWFARMVLILGEYLGAKYADAVICVSPHIAEDIKRRFQRETVFIPNGVKRPHARDTETALKKFGLSKGRYIFSLGRFVPEKGFHDLIDAFRTLRPDGWKLAIAGEEMHGDRYDNMLKDKAAAGKDIVFTGFLSGTPLDELYSHAGIFVLPSYHEGLPIALLEAMSYGLSCVVSDIPANRIAGLAKERFFEPGAIKQLSERLAYFIKNPISAEEKSRQMKYVTGIYDWDKIADRTLEVYNTVMERRR